MWQKGGNRGKGDEDRVGVSRSSSGVSHDDDNDNRVVMRTFFINFSLDHLY